MASQDSITLRVEPAIAAIAPADWDACANPGSAGESEPSFSGSADNPFVSHAFLSALEDSGAVSAETGWLPRHLVLDAGEGRPPLAVLPAYLKSHSQGEYVFDHGWADAYERAGGRYYPKLQAAVPFTPVPGPRLLARPQPNADEARRALGVGAAERARRAGASSVHVTFAREHDANLLAELGYLHRTDQQFHWFNEDFADFNAFLSSLASRKRKAIRRERREALAPGIAVEWVTGRDLTEAHWDAFHAFYMDTGGRKWGRPYLSREFFSLLGERMADRVLLVLARQQGRYIAGALNLIGSDALYGRNWGCVEDHPFLHFEVCYYQAIDFALAHGLARVEAGAQGEHKLARGYRPVTTHSAHWIADPGLREAVAHYLERERDHVEQLHAELETLTPFRRG